MKTTPTAPDFSHLEADARALRRAEMERLAASIASGFAEWRNQIEVSLRKHHEAWLRRSSRRVARLRGHEHGMPV